MTSSVTWRRGWTSKKSLKRKQHTQSRLISHSLTSFSLSRVMEMIQVSLSTLFLTWRGRFNQIDMHALWGSLDWQLHRLLPIGSPPRYANTKRRRLYRSGNDRNSLMLLIGWHLSRSSLDSSNSSVQTFKINNLKLFLGWILIRTWAKIGKSLNLSGLGLVLALAVATLLASIYHPCWCLHWFSEIGLGKRELWIGGIKGS